jgi:hypothetical protein
VSPWRSRKARLFPEQQVARSSRAGDASTYDSRRAGLITHGAHAVDAVSDDYFLLYIDTLE